jgi:hypothetical protein
MRNKTAVGVGAGAAGISAMLAGVVMIALKIQIAATFLGARTIFGMPFDNSDATKIVLVAVLGLAAIGFGVLLSAAGAGLTLFGILRGGSAVKKNVASGGNYVYNSTN